MTYKVFTDNLWKNLNLLQVFCSFVKGLSRKETENSGKFTPSLFPFRISYRFQISFREPECQNFSVDIFNSEQYKMGISSRHRLYQQSDTFLKSTNDLLKQCEINLNSTNSPLQTSLAADLRKPSSYADQMRKSYTAAVCHHKIRL